MQAKLDTVKKHMNGKRFNAAKGKSVIAADMDTPLGKLTDTSFGHVAEFEKDERELMEEPDLETSEEVRSIWCLHQCLQTPPMHFCTA